MNKILLGILIGLGVAASAGIVYAGANIVVTSNKNIWNNYTFSSQADSFVDGGNTCYVLENSTYHNPVSISCIKN